MAVIAHAASSRRAAFRRVWRDPHLRKGLAAYLAFSSVEFAVWVVVLVYAYAAGDATAVGLVAFAQLVPSALLAPALSSIVDRLPRSAAPAVAYGTVTLALAALAWTMLAGLPFWLVVMAAVICNVIMGMCRPAHHALTPCLAPDPSVLVAANVVATASEGLGLFIGPAMVGALMTVAPLGVAVAACAVSMLAATVLVLRIPASAAVVPAGRTPIAPGTMAGLRQVRAEPAARLPLATSAGQGLVEGAVDVLIVLLALEVLDLGDGGVGLLTAIVGVGAIIGGLASSSLVGRARLAPALLTGTVLTGTAMVLIWFLPTAALLLAAIGLGYSVTGVATRTILQRLTPIPVMGRMFGLMESVTLAGLAAGALLAPIVSNAVGVEAAFALFGLVLPAAVGTMWRMLRSADSSVSVPVAILELLRRIEFVAGMEPEAIEALARGSRTSAAAAGETIVVEGEPGDNMYVVVSGLVEVTRQGRTLASLGPGDMFGEVALLSANPRIATVTTSEPTSLVVVPKPALVAALATDPTAARALEQLAASRRRETLGEL